MKRFLNKNRILALLLLLSLTLTACGGSAESADQVQTAAAETPTTAPAAGNGSSVKESPSAADEKAEETGVDSAQETILTEEPVEVDVADSDVFRQSITGEIIFEDPALRETVEEYTAAIISEAYSHYYEIIGFDYAYSDIVYDGDSFTLTYGTTMHYMNLAASTEEPASRPKKTLSLLLQLEGMDNGNREFFSLYEMPENVLTNKGMTRIPIEKSLPPIPKGDSIAVPLGCDEYFGRLRLEGNTLFIHTMQWNVDLTGSVPNGYTITDLEEEISFPLGSRIQMAGLNGSSTGSVMEMDAQSLQEYLTKYHYAVFWVYVNSGEVLAIIEQYRP